MRTWGLRAQHYEICMDARGGGYTFVRRFLLPRVLWPRLWHPARYRPAIVRPAALGAALPARCACRMEYDVMSTTEERSGIAPAADALNVDAAGTPSFDAPAEPAPEEAGPSFADLGLSATVLKAVRSLHYSTPTPVQAEAIPAVLAGRDLLAAAQTGTGKTAAFLLPALDRLGHVVPRGRDRKRAAGRGPLMLIITPTRELAQQIDEVCTKIAACTKHIAVTVVGGVGYNPQRSALRRGCDVLVATPGRLVDLIEQGACHLDEVSVLVLDEADRMLDMGFLPQVRSIVERTPETRQTLLFSATLDEKAVGSITDLVHDPARVEIAPATATADTIDQYVLPVSLEAKNGLLAQVLKKEGPERVIVFMRTKHRADSCCRRLNKAGISAAPIHGDRSQAQRERALAAFRAGKVDVLVATDVLSRGIDITDVRYVVNFDVPAEPTDYIHRIGRTGRAGELGWALTMVTSADVDEFYAIEALMGKTAELYDATGLDVGVEPPAVDPNRIPEQHKGKKKTKRGKSTSKKKRSSARRRTEHVEGEGTAEERSSRSARPARPKRAGRARVRAEEEAKATAARKKPQQDQGAAAAPAADTPSATGDHGNWSRHDRRASAARTKSTREHAPRERAGRATSGRVASGRTISGRTSASSGHDWRNSDLVDERRGRGGRSARAEHRAPRGARSGRMSGSGARRPGDRGGRR